RLRRHAALHGEVQQHAGDRPVTRIRRDRNEARHHERQRARTKQRDRQGGMPPEALHADTPSRLSSKRSNNTSAPARYATPPMASISTPPSCWSRNAPAMACPCAYRTRFAVASSTPSRVMWVAVSSSASAPAPARSRLPVAPCPSAASHSSTPAPRKLPCSSA